MIKVENLEMSYGSFKALDKISFEVRPGEVVGLLGPNGAGKSTTMKILTTFLHPQGGKAEVAGFDVRTHPLEVRSRIGYLPENLPLYPEMEVKEYLQFVGRARSLSGPALGDRLDWAVATLGLEPVYRKLCRELSKGFRQRVGLAQALLHDPSILLLDEPTSGLDPFQIMGIRGLVQELGQTKTVVFSTHVLQEAEAVSNRIVIINRGRIVGDGSVTQLRARAKAREKTLVSVQADPKAVEEALAALPGCLSIQNLGAVSGYTRFEVSAESDRRLWRAIGEMAQERNWKLELLKDEPLTLEETFMALTGAAEQGGLETS